MGRNRISKEQKKETKRIYMMNKVWKCEVCNDFNYTLSGKWQHLKTRKHNKNIAKHDEDKAEKQKPENVLKRLKNITYEL